MKGALEREADRDCAATGTHIDERGFNAEGAQTVHCGDADFHEELGLWPRYERTTVNSEVAAIELTLANEISDGF